jgi:hypothetical protein
LFSLTQSCGGIDVDLGLTGAGNLTGAENFGGEVSLASSSLIVFISRA